MLTTWKQTRTSIEYIPPTTDRGDQSAKKKKKSSAASTPPDDVIIGAQFVQPLARSDPFYQERVANPSGKKKKRKSNHGHNVTGEASGSMDMEPILCLTSPHRVVFMGNQIESDGRSRSAAAAADGHGINLAESKSRNYVTRPGAASRFSLCGSSNTGGAFGGMVPSGAQYDPTSNLIYAIRNGGRGVAIWTAAPSSVLQGPDDDEVVMNGSTKQNARKRKPQPHQNDCASAIVSQCLQVPEGKVAVTLTPFSIPTSSQKGVERLAAIGAAGCCDDGSIWVAICFRTTESCNEFQLITVDGSSMADKDAATSGAKVTRTRRKPPANKANTGNGKSGMSWVLLDSCATGAINSRDKLKSSVILSIHSVILLEEKDSQVVAFRKHQVHIHNRESSDATKPLYVNVERCTKQDILQLGPSESDIAVKLDSKAAYLSIIHRKKNEDDHRWMLSSVDISQSDGALVKSMRTFPLPLDERMADATTVCSFGRVSQNVVAVLMKSQASSEHPKEACLMSLRIIDFRRKAELSSLCWTQGGGNDEGPATIVKDHTLNKMLHGKKCHAMITNELDGSIAILLTPAREDDDNGSSFVDILFSKLETNSTKTSQSQNATSLASALRFVATSEKSAGSKGNRTSNVYLPDALSVSADDNSDARQNELDDAVDKACNLLATSAKDMIELIASSSDPTETTNGKSRKGRPKASKKKDECSISWEDVYHEGKVLIEESKGGQKVNSNQNLINGIRVAAKGSSSALEPTKTNELPKRFVEAAFKESAAILLSLSREKEAPGKEKERQTAVLESTSILLEIIQTNLISARTDFGLGLLHCGNVFLSTLQAWPSSLSMTDAHKKGILVGKLHFIDAMLEHVRDIPEGVLVSIVRFVLRNVTVEDVVTYYSSATQETASSKGIRLSNQYKDMMDAQEDGQKQAVGTRLLSEAVLDFTSKMVTYSNCNHSFLSKAMQERIKSNGEVETLLLTLSKLLKLGSTRKLSREDNDDSSPDDNPHSRNQVSLSLGTINWIRAMTDAHMGTILKITNEGGLVIDRIQRAVRSAMAQSEYANELREISDLMMSGEANADNLVTKSSLAQSKSNDTAIAPYTIERLAF